MINATIDVDKLEVTCPITGEKMQKFTRLHAEQVGYKTLTQYRKENGLDFLTVAQRTRQKLKYLYNIDFTKWVVGYRHGEGMRYVHKKYVEDYEGAVEAGMRSASKYLLSDAAFNRHLKGQNPIAIFAYGTHSRWFGFDVDSKEQAQADTFKLINTLEVQGINKEDIHVSFSGSIYSLK